jgi:hypothetical protein
MMFSGHQYPGAVVCAIIIMLSVSINIAGAREDDALPYDDEIVVQSGPRMFHIGLMVLGVRKVGGVGLGAFGMYGDVDRRLAWVGEFLLMNSGERHIPTVEAHNKHYIGSDGLPIANVNRVFEEMSMLGFGGGVVFRVLQAPKNVGIYLPGLSIGLTGGIMLETDRVGLRPSDVDQYTGYGNSDTNISLRPYLGPRIMVRQGPFSVAGGMTVFPIFTSWTVGIAYGW